MEATLRDRGGAGQSCYGGFAACQVTRSTSELSDRSPGAAPVAAPEVAALEKTLKQLQLEVAACNQACNPVCRSPPPRVSSLQPCVPGGGRGDTARGRRCAQRRACSSKLAYWWRHSSAARPPRTDPPGAELLYALQKSARAAPIAMKRLWCHPCVPKLEPSRCCFYPPRHAPRGGGGTLADRRPRKSVGCLLLPGRPCVTPLLLTPSPRLGAPPPPTGCPPPPRLKALSPRRFRPRENMWQSWCIVLPSRWL